MKKRLSIFGIIAMAAIMVFATTACDDSGGGGDGGDPALSGTISITVNGDVSSTAETGDTLAAVYSGTESVSYQWKKGNDNAGTGATLVPDTAGSYTVTVSASGYKSKTSAAVTVSESDDPRVLLSAGTSPVNAAYNATSANAAFTGAGSLTSEELSNDDFEISGGRTITGVAVSGGTVTVTVSLDTNPYNSARSFTVSINKDSEVIRGGATVTITQAANPSGVDDNRKVLTAGGDVSASANDIHASVTFTGATGLSLETVDFTVTGTGSSVTGVSISGDTVTVTIGFSQNTTGEDRHFVVSVAASSTKIECPDEITITQHKVAEGSKLDGAPVGKPEASTVSPSSISVYAVAVPANGQTVEYAISKNTTPVPSAGWQDGVTFSSLDPDTAYYVFARSKANDTYNAGTPNVSSAISTEPEAVVNLPVEINAASLVQTYDGTPRAVITTAVDGANSFTAWGVLGTWLIEYQSTSGGSATETAPINAGEYSVLLTTGGGSLYPEFIRRPIATLHIDHIALTITSATHTRAYTGGTEANGVTVVLDGVIASDSGNVSPNTVSAAYTNQNAGTTTINITEVTLTGSAAANYTVTPRSNVTVAGITKAQISSATIHLTAPAKGQQPQTTASHEGGASVHYSIGAVSWTPASFAPVTGAFLGSTAYTATMTLSVESSNYEFTSGFNATVDGSAATLSDNNGSSVTLTRAFTELSEKVAVGLAVKTQPTKLTYAYGDTTLDLSGLVVTLTYDDTTTLDVAYADFGTNSITANPSADYTVTLSDNGTPVVVEYGSLRANTSNLVYALIVTDSSTWSDAWIQIRQAGNGNYTITVDDPSPGTPGTNSDGILIGSALGGGDGDNVTVTLQGSGRLRAYTSEDVAIVVGAGATLIIDSSSLILEGTKVGGNQNADNQYSVIRVWNGGRLELKAGTIGYNCSRFNSGGGVDVLNGSTFVMTGGTIIGNSATNSEYGGFGGGVYLEDGASFTKTGGTIYGSDEGANSNTAVNGGNAVYWNRSAGKRWYDGTLGPSSNLSTATPDVGWQSPPPPPTISGTIGTVTLNGTNVNSNNYWITATSNSSNPLTNAAIWKQVLGNQMSNGSWSIEFAPQASSTIVYFWILAFSSSTGVEYQRLLSTTVNVTDQPVTGVSLGNIALTNADIVE
jgi:hypothetical protein